MPEKDFYKTNEQDLIRSLDQEIQEKEEQEDRKYRVRQTVLKTLIWIFSILAASLLLGYTAMTFLVDLLGLGSSREIDIKIEKGTSTAKIAEQLEDSGVIKSAFMFRIYAKLKNYGADFKYGVYVMSADMGYDSIAEMLSTQGQLAEAVRVTIPEGASLDEIAAKLEEKGVCSKKDFIKVAKTVEFDYDFLKTLPTENVYYKLEGYLYPDTYEFYNYGGEECARRAIDKMLSNFESKFTKELINAAAGRGYTLHQITTMASIIELEAGSASYENKQKVSAVFFNRLAWTSEPNRLGSSPTALYPYGNGKYDTNKITGLPPGPLCSPSIDSIRAAIDPQKDFTKCYFVTDVNHEFYYNDTYAQHLATINKLKNQGLWAQ